MAVENSHPGVHVIWEGVEVCITAESSLAISVITAVDKVYCACVVLACILDGTSTLEYCPMSNKRIVRSLNATAPKDCMI